MVSLKPLFYDFVRAFYAPKSLYKEIHDGRSTPSWLCVLIYCLIYVIGCLWLYSNGYKPFMKPWITLDPNIYYLLEAFYLTPLIFLMWIQGAGTIHMLSKFFKGKGRFDMTLKMTGYSFWAPWYPLIIADIVHSTPDWLYNLVLIFCMLFIIYGTAISVKVEENIGWVGSIISSIFSIAAMGIIIFTFIR
jgi:hypothetical protein